MRLMTRTSPSVQWRRRWRTTLPKRSTKLVLERIDPAEVEWSQLDSLSDRNVFQTREWVEFVEATQAAEPVVARVLDGGRTVAFFTGLLARRFGVRILGSPFQGWATGYLGFNRLEAISNRDAVAALVDFAFGPLGCLHLEFRDRPLAGSDVDRHGDISGARTHGVLLGWRELASVPIGAAQRSSDVVRDSILARAWRGCLRLRRRRRLQTQVRSNRGRRSAVQEVPLRHSQRYARGRKAHDQPETTPRRSPPLVINRALRTL